MELTSDTVHGTVEQDELRTIIQLSGEIDHYSARSLQQFLDRVVAETSQSHVVLDLRGVEFMSSAGIGAFIHVLRLVEGSGRRLFLMNMKDQVRDLFQLLGFYGMFRHVRNLDDTSDSLKETEVFPRIMTCPVCTEHFRAVRPGRFRCGNCKCIISIGEDGNMFLG